MGLPDFSFSLQMRDIIQRLMRESIDTLRPRYRYAKVVSFDRVARKCTIIFNGETNPVIVNMGSIQPAAVDQIVRVEGIGTDKFITDVIGDPYLYSLATTQYVDDKDTARGTTTTNLVNARTVAPSASWQTLILGNGWVNYVTDGFTTAAYRMLSNGQVEIKGLIKSGTIGQFAQLPVGYRPGERVLVTTSSVDHWARYDIAPDGVMTAGPGVDPGWLNIYHVFWADN